ncbi:MAG: arylsulfatase [Phycisphaerales bacterium]|nr:arylsulfatase [Phycisphaerales bacterium]
MPSTGCALPTILLAAIALCLAFLVAATDNPAPPQAPPNIVIVFADDLGIGDVTCMNSNSKIPTPRMDQVAASGMRFTDAHSPAAVCTPSRYALLTGRYPWRSSLKRWVLGGSSPALLEPDRPTMASLLADQGYQTSCIGKWHLGLGTQDPVDWEAPLRPGPQDAGFDEFYGISASLDMPPYVFIENDRPVAELTGQVDKSGHRRQGGGGFWRAGRASEDFEFDQVLPRITSRAEETIKRFAADDRPFLVYVPLTAPHTPWVPTTAFDGRTSIGHYGDFTAQVDDTVGRIVDALDEAGALGNTLLIVTSDNGSHWPDADIEKWKHDGNMGYRGQKADIWEGGHRIPLLVSWPGVIEPGSTCDKTICLTDLFATCVTAGGGQWDTNAGEDSVDLGPLLRNETWSDPREGIIHQSGDGLLAIRCGKWKLIEALGSGGFSSPKRPKPDADGPAGQLYDLEVDPAETTNLYNSRPEIVARLTTLLEQIRTQPASVPPGWNRR